MWHMVGEQVRVWLVDRAVTEKPSLINHIYATEDGERYMLIERSSGGSAAVEESKAGMDVDADELSPVDDPELQAEYAAEAERMAEKHAPEDAI